MKDKIFLLITVCLVAFIIAWGRVSAEETEIAQPSEDHIQTSSIGGGNNQAPMIGSALGQTPNQFLSADINLTNGSVGFSNIDLQLPGKNGHDLIIGRSYNSQFYRSDPADDVSKGKTWGGWAGHGWSFSFAMRAFIVNCDDNAYKKIIIDNSGMVETYEYHDNNTYLSSKPGNFSKAKFQHYEKPPGITIMVVPYPDAIILENTDGTRYIFEKQFYTETIDTNHWRFRVCGFYLTEIKDVNNNTIKIDYRFLHSYTIQTCTLGYLIGDSYKYLDRHYDDIYTNLAEISSYVPERIVDSFSRIINIHFNDPGRNHCSLNNDLMITGIVYKNVNGGDSEIKYKYDLNGNLASVQINELPERAYSYRNYDLLCKLIVYKVNTGSLIEPRYVNHYKVCYLDEVTDKSSYYAEVIGDNSYPYGYRYDFTQPCEYIYQNYIVPKEIVNYLNKYKLDCNGYLLESITSPLGSIISYEYKDCLVRMDARHEVIGVQYNPYTPDIIEDAYIFELVLGQATFPVVVKKIVNENPGQSFTYSYIYPQDIKNHVIKCSYIPANTDGEAKAYFFDTVMVDNPPQIADIKYQFQNGLIKSSKQEIFETITDWDYSKNRQTQIVSKKNDVTQTKKVIEYDDARFPFNNPVKVTTYVGDNNPNIVEEYTYNTNSDLLGKHLVNLVKTSKIYDYNDPNKANQYYYTYDVFGKIWDIYEGIGPSDKPIKKYRHYLSGRLAQEFICTTTSATTSEHYLQIDYEYPDGNNYIIKKKYNGKEVTKEYSPHTGSLLKSTDENNKVTEYEYDEYGRITKISVPRISSKLDNGDIIYTYPDLKTTEITFGDSNRKETEYLDNFGRVIKITKTGEEDIEYQYYFSDKISNLYKAGILKKSIIYDDYLRQTHAKNTGWGTTVSDYHSTDNGITITDYKGRELVRTIDQLGRLVSQSFDSDTTSYGYDVFGNITKVTTPRDGIYHSSGYDAYGRLIHTYKPNSTDAWVTNSYYDSSLLKNTIIAGGNTYAYEYDIEGRLTKTTVSKPDGSSEVEELFYGETYPKENGKGCLTKAVNSMCTTEFGYDESGHLKKETKTYRNNSIAGKKFEATNDYNNKGQLERIIYTIDGVSQYVITYLYRSNDGHLEKIKYGEKDILFYGYNSNGTIDYITYGNNYRLNFDYDPNREVLVEDTQFYNDSQIIYAEGYGYDVTGNLTSTSFTDLFKPNGNMNKAYRYNNRDELTNVKINDQDNYYVFDYDKNGNRIKFENFCEQNLSPYTIDEYDRITRRTYPSGDITFEYDAMGNMKYKHIYSGSEIIRDIHYIYNYQDCLVEVRADNKDGKSFQPIAQYEYDTKRQRIYSSTNYAGATETKIYHWDSIGNIIGEGTPNQDFTVKYIYSGNEKIAMIRVDAQGRETLYYFINNLQGTPVLIIDEGGNIVQKVRMDAYGNVEQMRGIFADEINYTGKKLDRATGLYYFNQRYYDPDLGRFITRDTANQSLNPYLFCANNPLNYIEPDGEWFFAALFTVLFGPGGGTAIGAAIDNACWAGTAAAGINAGVQWAANDFDASRINWNSVGQAFISGAVMYGVTSATEMINIGDDLAANMVEYGMRGGINNVASRMLVGKNMSFENTWRSFGEGFMQGLYTGTLKETYKMIVGFEATLESGGDPSRTKYDQGLYAVKGANNIGIPIGQDTGFSEGIRNMLREGGEISRVLNKIPGFNAAAGLHDSLCGMNLPFANDLYSIPSFAVSLYYTYSALY